MPAPLYAVVGTIGEYDKTEFWIAWLGPDAAEAQALCTTHNAAFDAALAAHSDWKDRKSAAEGEWYFPREGDLEALHARGAAFVAANPRPAFDADGSYKVVPIPVGVWYPGRYVHGQLRPHIFPPNPAPMPECRAEIGDATIVHAVIGSTGVYELLSFCIPYLCLDEAEAVAMAERHRDTTAPEDAAFHAWWDARRAATGRFITPAATAAEKAAWIAASEAFREGPHGRWSMEPGEKDCYRAIAVPLRLWCRSAELEALGCIVDT